ncbi:hypothetical protein [Nocardia sp. NPDC006630]|uniref:hypothetical protein n=1 Tax=Nocardia sp. NPDC006630 TaxID=3157181 RepID=UPI0033BA59C7
MVWILGAWVLPPIAYVLTRRNESAWQQRVMESLTPQQRTQFVTYSNKAAGWFVVGGGAALIGIKEAAELVKVLDWPSWVVLPLWPNRAPAQPLWSSFATRSSFAGDSGETVWAEGLAWRWRTTSSSDPGVPGRSSLAGWPIPAPM